jgi:hypothetical protein
MPLAVGPIHAQGEHVIGVGSQPPRAWKLEALLHDVAVSALDFA